MGESKFNMFTEFEKKVLNLVAYIPKGKVTTYKELARAGGCYQGAQAIGNVLHKNPYLYRIPCHRVVKSDGQIGGFSQGQDEKIRLLKNEGVEIKGQMIVKFSKIFYIFK